MRTYTLHVTFTAPDDGDALDAGRIITRHASDAFQCVRDADALDTWDVSGTDHTGAQDWSTLIPREVTA